MTPMLGPRLGQRRFDMRPARDLPRQTAIESHARPRNGKSRHRIVTGNSVAELSRTTICSASDVQDRVRVVRTLLQRLDCFRGGQDQEFDFSAFGFAFYFIHGRQLSGTGTDHEPLTFPRNLLLDRQRRVRELLTESLRWLLLALADLATVDHHVVFVSDTINAD